MINHANQNSDRLNHCLQSEVDFQAALNPIRGCFFSVEMPRQKTDQTKPRFCNQPHFSNPNPISFCTLNPIEVDFTTVEMPGQKTDQFEPLLFQPENYFLSPNPEAKPPLGVNISSVEMPGVIIMEINGVRGLADSADKKSAA